MREWLRVIRERNGYSQYKIAKLAGISQGYYASIETGGRGSKLPVDTAKKIAQALRIDWTLFYDDESIKNGRMNRDGDSYDQF